MQRQFVQSSNLRSIGYDVAGFVLEIEFNDATVYQYYSVPIQVYSGLINASSHGKYFHAYIEDRYQYKKVL